MNNEMYDVTPGKRLLAAVDRTAFEDAAREYHGYAIAWVNAMAVARDLREQIEEIQGELDSEEARLIAYALVEGSNAEVRKANLLLKMNDNPWAFERFVKLTDLKADLAGATDQATDAMHQMSYYKAVMLYETAALTAETSREATGWQAGPL